MSFRQKSLPIILVIVGPSDSNDSLVSMFFCHLAVRFCRAAPPPLQKPINAKESPRLNEFQSACVSGWLAAMRLTYLLTVVEFTNIPWEKPRSISISA